MSNQIQNYSEWGTEDYTPTVAVTAGKPLEIGGQAALANNDIAANQLGAVQVRGLVKVVKINGIFAVGDDVWWDINGNPEGGVVGSGAATNVAASGDFYLGSVREAAIATDIHAIVALNEPAKQAAIVDAVAAGQTGSGAEQDALGAKINEILVALENTGIIANA